MMEIIALDERDILAAKAGGANRVELIRDYSSGGLTPEEKQIRQALRCGIDVAVMLRPQESFFTKQHDLAFMQAEAKRLEELGVGRIVVGLLDDRGLADVDALKFILRDRRLRVTFHRAIDSSSDILTSLERINEVAAVDWILTSGGLGPIEEHIGLIEKMVTLSHPRLMLGGGLSLTNFPDLAAQFGERVDWHFGQAARSNRAGAVEAGLVQKLAEVSRGCNF